MPAALATDTATMVKPLLDAGKALATLADPDRDLADLGSMFRELAMTLDGVGKGLNKSYLATIEAKDKHEIEAMELGARRDAARTASRALIDLGELLGSIYAGVAASASPVLSDTDILGARR